MGIPAGELGVRICKSAGDFSPGHERVAAIPGCVHAPAGLIQSHGQAFLHGIISCFPFYAQFPAAQGCQWLGDSAFGSQMSLPPSRRCGFPPYPCSQQCRRGLRSSHTPVFTGDFFSWSWNGMLQKCCHKLLRSYLERVGGLIRCYEAQPSHTTSRPWLMARILDTFSSYYQLQKSFQQNLKESVKEYRLLPIFSVCYSKMSEKFEHYQKNSTMGCFLLCVSRIIPL